jgi:hypothetical protein
LYLFFPSVKRSHVLLQWSTVFTAILSSKKLACVSSHEWPIEKI